MLVPRIHLACQSDKIQALIARNSVFPIISSGYSATLANDQWNESMSLFLLGSPVIPPNGASIHGRRLKGLGGGGEGSSLDPWLHKKCFPIIIGKYSVPC